MDFWQTVTICALLIGIISSIVAVVGFFVDVRQLKHKHRILLISVPLAIVLLAGGVASLLYHPISSSALNANNSPAKGLTSTPIPTDTTPISTNTITRSATPSVTATVSSSPTATSTAPVRQSPTPNTLPYTANWSSGLNGWVGSPAWKVSQGMLLSDGTNFDNGIVQTLISCPCQTGTISDYAVEAIIQVVRSGGGGYGGSMGLFVRGDGQNNGYWLGENSFSQAFVGISSQGNYTTAKTVSYSPDLNVHTLRVEARGNTITLFIDGGKIISLTDNTYISGGQVGIFAADDEIEVKSFKVYSL